MIKLKNNESLFGTNGENQILKVTPITCCKLQLHIHILVVYSIFCLKFYMGVAIFCSLMLPRKKNKK